MNRTRRAPLSRAACGAAKMLTVSVWLLQGLAASADGPAVTPALPAEALDSAAQAELRKLARATPRPNATSTLPAPENEITRLDEIRVYGTAEPEDQVRRKPAPMLDFRARLDRERPASAKDITQGILCVIGLCGRYGPEGIPAEPSREQRAEDRRNQPFTPSSGRGTLQ